MTRSWSASWHPVLTLEDVRFSVHAEERIAQWRLRRALAERAIVDPARAWYANLQESWNFERGPVVVALRPDYLNPGKWVVTTVWASQEMQRSKKRKRRE